MIAEGMRIQIRRSGTTVAMESLQIGDLVYDPVTDNYNEVIDILSRTSIRDPEMVRLIPSSSLAGGRPVGDLIVSRRQILLTARFATESRDVVEHVPAFTLGAPLGKECRLFALFLEKGGHVLVNGVCAAALEHPLAELGGQLPPFFATSGKIPAFEAIRSRDAFSRRK